MVTRMNLVDLIVQVKIMNQQRKEKSGEKGISKARNPDPDWHPKMNYDGEKENVSSDPEWLPSDDIDIPKETKTTHENETKTTHKNDMNITHRNETGRITLTKDRIKEIKSEMISRRSLIHHLKRRQGKTLRQVNNWKKVMRDLQNKNKDSSTSKSANLPTKKSATGGDFTFKSYKLVKNKIKQNQLFRVVMKLNT